MTYHSNASILKILCKLDGSVFPRVFLRAVFFGAIGAVAVCLWHVWTQTYERCISANSDMHTYMSMMVALLIGFRTNNCYSRYDRGVQISGAMRTHARTLVGQAIAYIQQPAAAAAGAGAVDDEAQAVAVQQHIGEIRRYTLLLCLFFKRHMHGQDAGFAGDFSTSRSAGAGAGQGESGAGDLSAPLVSLATGAGQQQQQGGRAISEWAGPLSSQELRALTACASGNERVALCSVWLRQEVAKATEAGLLHSAFASIMDTSVTAILTNFQGACRLVFVPMPFPYAQVVKAGICLFCVMTPFAIVTDLKYATPLASFFLALFFLSVEEIGVAIEDPFGKHDAAAEGDSMVTHPRKLTHFVNLDAVIREIDAQTTTLILATQPTDSRHQCGPLLSGSHTDHFSVDSHSHSVRTHRLRTAAMRGAAASGMWTAALDAAQTSHPASIGQHMRFSTQA